MIGRRCHNHHAAEAETWADCDTSLGVVRLWLCTDCLDADDLPGLSALDCVVLVRSHPDFVEPDE